MRNFKLAEFVEDLATTNWWWVALAIVSDIGVYILQAFRWKLLLHPVEPASLWQTLRAIYVGQFGNEALGFNAGELVRCYLITRWTALPFSVSISSALIERIFDGIWLSACLFLALKIVPHPAHMRLLVGSEYVLLGFVILGSSLLAIALFHKQRAHAALSGKTWQRQLRVLIDDLSLIGHSRYLYFAFLLSMPFLLLQSIPIYATFRGYGFEGLALYGRVGDDGDFAAGERGSAGAGEHRILFVVEGNSAEDFQRGSRGGGSFFDAAVGNRHVAHGDRWSGGAGRHGLGVWRVEEGGACGAR